jgi:hypothetical protein
MAKVDLSFNFGANIKSRKKPGGKMKAAKGRGTSHGRWAAYTGKKR